MPFGLEAYESNGRRFGSYRAYLVCSNRARTEPNGTEKRWCRYDRKRHRYAAFSNKVVRIRNALAAFARRRSGVRIPSAPLQNFLQTTKKLKILVITPGRCAAAVPQPE